MTELVNVDELAAQALANNVALLAMLPNGADSIYHDNAPENGEYPLIQYSMMTEIPAFHCDNKLKAVDNVVRVTIINNTNAGRYSLKNAVYNALVDAGFMWINTNTVRNGREYYTALDFRLGTLVKYNNNVQ